MDKIKVTIQITIRADRDDEDGIREAVQDKLRELIEAEELDFTLDEDEDEDYED